MNMGGEYAPEEITFFEQTLDAIAGEPIDMNNMQLRKPWS
jgi:hypothetical protein